MISELFTDTRTLPKDLAKSIKCYRLYIGLSIYGIALMKIIEALQLYFLFFLLPFIALGLIFLPFKGLFHSVKNVRKKEKINHISIIYYWGNFVLVMAFVLSIMVFVYDMMRLFL